jgi:hypothetical protein
VKTLGRGVSKPMLDLGLPHDDASGKR